MQQSGEGQDELSFELHPIHKERKLTEIQQISKTRKDTNTKVNNTGPHIPFTSRHLIKSKFGLIK